MYEHDLKETKENLKALRLDLSTEVNKRMAAVSFFFFLSHHFAQIQFGQLQCLLVCTFAQGFPFKTMYSSLQEDDLRRRLIEIEELEHKLKNANDATNMLQENVSLIVTFFMVTLSCCCSYLFVLNTC